jgi:beta-carotene hydroxylase
MNQKLLNYNEDWYTLFCMFAFTFLLLAPFFMSIPLYIFPIWILFSFHFSFCVNLINHNHAHVATFKNQKLNFAMDLWLTILRGASAIFIKIIHNGNHHQYEGSKEDWFSPENEGHGNPIERISEYLFVTTRRFKNGAKDFYSKMDQDFNHTRKVEKVILVIFITSLLIINYRLFLIYVLPTWIFGNFFLVYTNLIFHKGAKPNKKLCNSFNFLNPIENALYFNGGYHTIHHLHPNIHWSKLREAHQIEISHQINPIYLQESIFIHLVKNLMKDNNA